MDVAMSPALLGSFTIAHHRCATSWSGWWCSESGQMTWARSWTARFIVSESWDSDDDTDADWHSA